MGKIRKQESLERMTERIESRDWILTPYGKVLPVVDVTYSLDRSNKLLLHNANFILMLEHNILNRGSVTCDVFNENPNAYNLLNQMKGYNKKVAGRFASPYQGRGILFTPEQIETLYSITLECGLERLEDKHLHGISR